MESVGECRRSSPDLLSVVWDCEKLQPWLWGESLDFLGMEVQGFPGDGGSGGSQGWRFRVFLGLEVQGSHGDGGSGVSGTKLGVNPGRACWAEAPEVPEMGRVNQG